MFKNKILPLLLSVAIAFCLWAYVITFVSSEREGTFYDIPVSYQGEALLEERNLMIVTEEKPTVTLTLFLLLQMPCCIICKELLWRLVYESLVASNNPFDIPLFTIIINLFQTP